MFRYYGIFNFIIMRVKEWINVCNIVTGKLPINPTTLTLIDYIRKHGIEDLPPIKVVKKGGDYILRDGRHRYTAYKLLGIEKIFATFYK